MTEVDDFVLKSQFLHKFEVYQIMQLVAVKPPLHRLKKNKHFFGFFHFFLYHPKFLDPKCYTWLESYGSEDSDGKR